MSKAKQEKLTAIKNLFQKHKVLQIDDLFKVIGTRSRRTVHRYIKEFEYLTSYSHKGRYYTLQEIAKFDINGLWHHGDIGFSKHGTLFETITYFVDHSMAGMTSNELKNQSRTVVKYALVDLVEKARLSRAKSDKVYVYLSSNPAEAKKQLREREKALDDRSIDQAVVLRILLAICQMVEEVPTVEQVALLLKQEGSKISLETIQKVFCHYGLEKKTSDFISCQS